jgi:predicted TIM-barrel fold metal-dependent hydrolase
MQTIVDPHHHLWNLRENYYPWLTDRITKRVCGEYSAIRKDYLLEDFFADIGDLPVSKSVHVQAEHDFADPVRETRWLQAIADDPKSRGFPHGIVAYADFCAPDIADILAAHADCANVRGIRQMVHENQLNPDAPDRLNDPAWQRNLGLLNDHGWSFDLQVYPPQARDAVRLTDRHGDIQFILCHTGQPSIQDEAGLARWRAAMRLLAERPNVAIKMSGFGMFDRAFTLDSIRPIILDTIDLFGVERVMFASNFPVDGMARSYASLWQTFSDAVQDFSEDERNLMFRTNAEKYYRI